MRLYLSIPTIKGSILLTLKSKRSLLGRSLTFRNESFFTNVESCSWVLLDSSLIVSSVRNWNFSPPPPPLCRPTLLSLLIAPLRCSRFNVKFPLIVVFFSISFNENVRQKVRNIENIHCEFVKVCSLGFSWPTDNPDVYLLGSNGSVLPNSQSFLSWSHLSIRRLLTEIPRYESNIHVAPLPTPLRQSQQVSFDASTLLTRSIVRLTFCDAPKATLCFRQSPPTDRVFVL